MRGRKVLLSSLGVGRCFTLPREDEDKKDDEAEKPLKGGAAIRRADPIVAPAAAWKVNGTAGEDGKVDVESAAGELKTFDAETRVVEIPRQGWDKLKSQAK